MSVESHQSTTILSFDRQPRSLHNRTDANLSNLHFFPSFLILLFIYPFLNGRHTAHSTRYGLFSYKKKRVIFYSPKSQNIQRIWGSAIRRLNWHYLKKERTSDNETSGRLSARESRKKKKRNTKTLEGYWWDKKIMDKEGREVILFHFSITYKKIKLNQEN